MDVKVDITVTNGVATYAGVPVGVVQSDGTIDIPTGTDAHIVFAPAMGQAWTFQDPWIAIAPLYKEITVDATSASEVVISDNNPTGAAESTYTYALYTTEGWLDPRIINKGGN